MRKIFDKYEGKVIRIDGKCYYYNGKTNEPFDTDPSVITDTFDTCYECETTWTPSDMTTIGWYDASDLSTITSSVGYVSQWNSKSGNTEHLVQSNGAHQPQTGTRTLNNLNVLDFDGMDDRMTTDNSFPFPIPSSGDVSMYMVATIDSVSSALNSIFSFKATPSNDFQIDADSGSQFNGEMAVSGIGTSVRFTGGPFMGPSIYNCNFDYTGLGSYNAFVDGTQRAVNTTYTNKLTTSGTLAAFANRGGGSNPNGAIAEFIIAESCLSTCRELIEGYLAWKWGIQGNLPIGHRYKTSAPTKPRK